MPRLMSAAFTEHAVRDRTKTVTRRAGWLFVRPGDRLTLCRKVMGRRKGEPLVRLVDVEVISVRREPLSAITPEDVAREGFPGMPPDEFVDRFFGPAHVAGRRGDPDRVALPGHAQPRRKRVPVMASWTPRLADTVVSMAGVAMHFGRIDRTACYHPGDGPAESDSDHTVMLGWIACALARRLAPDLDIGLVAQLALAHDAVEAYAGDTQTLRISDAERASKAEREHKAWLMLHSEFGLDLPWLPDTIRHYEGKASPEARFVWALDKTMPKLVHLLDNLRGLREFGMGHAELAGFFERQRESIAVVVAGEPWAGELLALHAELVSRVVNHRGWGLAAEATG